MIEWMESMRICGLHFKAIELTADGKLRDIAKPSIFKHATARRKEELCVFEFTFDCLFFE